MTWLKLLTLEEQLTHIRHSFAHLLAAAVLQKFPEICYTHFVLFGVEYYVVLRQ